MSITRRLFLRQSAAVGAVGAVATVPAAAEPELTPWKWALWHMRELERLAIEDGARSAMSTFTGLRYPDASSKSLIFQTDEPLWDKQGMFGGEKS